MNQTPHDPHGPGTGGGGADHHGDDPDGATAPIEPPPEPAETPPPDGAIALAPLDEVPTGRRFLSLGRLVAVTVVVLALVGGAAALASGGDGDDPNGEGVASIDGTEGEVANDGSSGNGESTPADDSKVFDAMLQFAECMREQGIDMPDPEMGEGGVQLRAGREGGPDGDDEEKFEAAHKACEHFMEDARADMPAPSPEERAEMQDALVAMAECMRGRGYDMPDPEVDGNGGVRVKVNGGPDGQPDGDEQFGKDQEECEAEAGMDEGPRGGAAGGS